MAFLRFSRDKRGYEHFQLVEPQANRRGSATPRILYWFRSPCNVRVGREPFDDAIKVALEQQNPGLEFDWTQILATPIPSAEAERWRERRRLERAARQSAAGEDEGEPGDAETSGTPDLKLAAAAGQTVVENPPQSTGRASSSTEQQLRPPDAGARRSRRRRGRRGRPELAAAQNTAEVPADSQEQDPEFDGEQE